MMPAQRLSPLALLTALAVIFAGCTSPETPDSTVAPTPDEDIVTRESVSGSTGSVGGSVKNSAPTAPTFTPSATEGENRGSFVVTFTGTVRDSNTENQIASIRVSNTGPSALGGVHTVTTDETNALTEPASFGGDGFKVWTGTKNDGVLNFKFRQTFPAFTPTGTYTFRSNVTDSPGLFGLSNTVDVVLTAFSDITVNATPVDATGAAQTGKNWGEWEAEAGAPNVAATNYLKLVNTGDVATASVVIDFDSTFIGADDSNFTISTASNVQFAWFEDTTPGASAPNEGTFTFGTANADGTVTVNFSGQNNIIYVMYRIVQLPEILPVQSYNIAFTVTEL